MSDKKVKDINLDIAVSPAGAVMARVKGGDPVFRETLDSRTSRKLAFNILRYQGVQYGGMPSADKIESAVAMVNEAMASPGRRQNILDMPPGQRRLLLLRYAEAWEGDEDFPLESKLVRSLLCDPAFGHDDDVVAYVCLHVINFTPGFEQPVLGVNNEPSESAEKERA